jgi:uncharacterized protein
MTNPLLVRWTPKDLADRRQVFNFKGKISNFPRLVEIVEEDLRDLAADSPLAAWRDAPVAIRLSCDWADESRKIPRLSGDVTAEVAATCQRCLEPFWLPVATELRYLLLPATGGRIADSAVDVWELEDDTIRLLDIVEESLIMALPLAATHGPEDACGVQADDSRDEPLELAKPFAGLRTQMDKLN